MLLTQAGLKRKQEELERLKQQLSEIREEKRVSFTQADGDGWHDNFGYEQGVRDEDQLLTRIEELLVSINEATIVEDDVNADFRVCADTNVKLKLDYGSGDVDTFIGRIVSVIDVSNINEISLNSPIGNAVYEKKKGDVVSCILPSGEKIKIEILEVG